MEERLSFGVKPLSPLLAGDTVTVRLRTLQIHANMSSMASMLSNLWMTTDESNHVLAASKLPVSASSCAHISEFKCNACMLDFSNLLLIGLPK